ncbi:MAG: transcriptional regulator NrdR [Candidatus Nanohaloarchaea archaeon]
MRCPYCENEATRVIDSRDSGERIRRRRECGECERRFTTYETLEKFDVKVTKRDGEVQDFREEKIRAGIERAAEKTSLTQEEVDDAVENVRKAIIEKQEVTTEEIGEKVLEELKKRDEVAYIRFASVYDSFENAESFQKEVEALQES